MMTQRLMNLNPERKVKRTQREREGKLKAPQTKASFERQHVKKDKMRERKKISLLPLFPLSSMPLKKQAQHKIQGSCNR